MTSEIAEGQRIHYNFEAARRLTGKDSGRGGGNQGRGREQVANPDTELSQEGLARRIYSKRGSLILAFSLFVVVEGAGTFVEQYRLTANPMRSIPSWNLFNSFLGTSVLNAASYVVFPAALFVVLYSLGDRFQLKENVVPLAFAIAIGGWVGVAVGYGLGLLAFLPQGFSIQSNIWIDYEAAFGLASSLMYAFFAFAVGFSAILLKQLRSKAVWIV
jgi:hypothetical protein